MATFSENQVSHLYVVTGVANQAPTTVGNIQFKAQSAAGVSYGIYKSALGDIIRTDAIDPSKILYAKKTLAASMARKLKKVIVSISGNPTAGEDYILGITINQFCSLSDSNPYYKNAAVHATTSMTPAQFYAKMAESLEKNFSREPVQMLSFAVVSTVAVTYAASTAYAVGSILKNSNKYYQVKTAITTSDGAFPTAKVTEIGDGIIISEVEQPWILGKKAEEVVDFTVQPGMVNDEPWGTVANLIGDTVNNGKKTADLEYFLLGERGDQYRMMGYPNNIETKGIANPATAYDYINIHYYSDEANENVQRQEKDLILACDSSVTSNLLSAVNTAFGLSLS